RSVMRTRVTASTGSRKNRRDDPDRYRPRGPRVYHATLSGWPNKASGWKISHLMEDRMRNHPASITACTILVAAGLVSGVTMLAHGQGAQAPVAPIGQESRGTSNLITPEKVASAMRLANDGIVVSLAHAEPQV